MSAYKVLEEDERIAVMHVLSDRRDNVASKNTVVLCRHVY
jgi:hypothetical protein